MYRSRICKCFVNVQITWEAKSQFIIKKKKTSRNISLQGMPSFNLKSYIYNFKKFPFMQQFAHLKLLIKTCFKKANTLFLGFKLVIYQL